MKNQWVSFKSSIALVASVFMGATLKLNAATPFNPDPIYSEAKQYTITITPNNEPADIYYPVLPETENRNNFVPIALVLPGALVDKSDYSNFASFVARYGFIVVVPNRERMVPAPTGEMVKALAPEQRQVVDILAEITAENQDSTSPIGGLVDTNKLGLLGHSYGGFVGLAAIQNMCHPNICSGTFNRPPQVKAGIFYGTNFRDPPLTGSYPPVKNGDIPIALIAGSLDQIADREESQSTYEQIQNPPKALVIVEGANHYGITNRDNLERDKVRPTLEQKVANETIARWSALFLRSHLLNDQNAFNYFYHTGDERDDGVRVITEN